MGQKHYKEINSDLWNQQHHFLYIEVNHLMETKLLPSKFLMVYLYMTLRWGMDDYTLPHSTLPLQISVALVCLHVTIRQSYTMMQATGQAVKGKLIGLRS